MNEWNRMNKWVITRCETDEVIEIYKGTFMEVMHYLNKNYEDDEVDVESYENWLERQQKGNENEQMLWLWIYVGRP